MKAIKIMFSTKKYLNKKTRGCSLKGYAYYVFNDEGIIVKQFIQIIEGEYRQTDFELALKIEKGEMGTRYYKSGWRKEFRTKYLDEINHDPNKFTINSPRKTLSKNQINQINEFFILNNSPILMQTSSLTGSNSNGAGQNPLSTPLMCLDKDYIKYNFANPLNEFCEKYQCRKSKINIGNINDLKTITLKEYFERYKSVVVVRGKENLTLDTFKVFNEINSYRILMDHAQKEYTNNIENKNLKLPVKKQKQKEFKKNVSVKNVQDDLRETIQTFKHVFLSKQQIKNRLQKHYNYGVRLLIKENKLSHCSFNDYPKPMNAHIISRESLFHIHDDESLFKYADPFNCLRLSPDIHGLFDNNIITFTTEGKIIDFEKKLWVNDPIKDILNSPERMKYISENYEYWKINKCNK